MGAIEGPLAAAAVALCWVWAGRGLVRDLPRRFAIAAVLLTWAVAVHLAGGGSAWAAIGLRAVSLASLVAAGGLAHWSLRQRALGRLLQESSYESLDEVIDQLRATGASRSGVFAGRLSADEPLTSPAGIVCAFYDSEIRELGAEGGRGPLLATERGAPPALYLRGERQAAQVAFSLDRVFAARRSRPCRVADELSFSLGTALAAGTPPSDAVSHERVGKLGERCFVAGELTRTGRGAYRVRGVGGGPALVVLGDAAEVAQRLVRRARSAIMVSGGLVALAAFFFARA